MGSPSGQTYPLKATADCLLLTVYCLLPFESAVKKGKRAGPGILGGGFTRSQLVVGVFKGVAGTPRTSKMDLTSL